VSQDVQIHTYSNGLTLLVEHMPHVRSAAFTFAVRGGCAYETSDERGLAGITLDLMTRGAGSRDNRQLNDALDALGVDRSESTGVMLLYLGGSTLSRNLAPALDLYADMLRRANLPEEELEPACKLALQDIQGLEDEPQSKVMVELRKRYYPDPLGRDHRGTAEGVNSATIAAVRRYYERHVQPAGLILSIAGDVDFATLKEQVGWLFGDWKASPVPEPKPGADQPASAHIAQELDQTQVALAYPSVAMDDPEFYAARGAVGVLSEGMSSRLFTEVREKYGLCYAIGARFETMRGRGTVVGYTAGRPEKAQELLDRTLHEFRRLADGIEEEELQRVKAGLKASLIMRQESTGARAGGNAADWYMLGRIRPLEEIHAQIDALTPRTITEHLQRFPPKEFTIVTLGSAPLAVH
jgi:predicted Zn-dependent peptidase